MSCCQEAEVGTGISLEIEDLVQECIGESRRVYVPLWLSDLPSPSHISHSAMPSILLFVFKCASAAL